MADSERGVFDTDDASALGERDQRFLVGYTRTSALPNGKHIAVVGMLDTQHTVDPYGTLLAESGSAQHADPNTALINARAVAEQNLRFSSGERALNDRGLRTVYDARNQTS